MERTIVMSHRELHRARVLEQVLQGALSLKEAKELLQVSYRQIRRLKKRYSRHGAGGLAHGNRGRPAPHALAKDRVTRFWLCTTRSTRRSMTPTSPKCSPTGRASPSAARLSAGSSDGQANAPNAGVARPAIMPAAHARLRGE